MIDLLIYKAKLRVPRVSNIKLQAIIIMHTRIGSTAVTALGATALTSGFRCVTPSCFTNSDQSRNTSNACAVRKDEVVDHVTGRFVYHRAPVARVDGQEGNTPAP